MLVSCIFFFSHVFKHPHADLNPGLFVKGLNENLNIFNQSKDIDQKNFRLFLLPVHLPAFFPLPTMLKKCLSPTLYVIDTNLDKSTTDRF